MENVSGSEIHRQLCGVYGADKVMSKRHAHKWITHFDDGWTNTQNEPRKGYPSDGVSNKTIACMHALVNADCHFIASDIFQVMATLYSHISIR